SRARAAEPESRFRWAGVDSFPANPRGCDLHLRGSLGRLERVASEDNEVGELSRFESPLLRLLERGICAARGGRSDRLLGRETLVLKESVHGPVHAEDAAVRHAVGTET